MSKKYANPEVEFVALRTEDVLAESGAFPEEPPVPTATPDPNYDPDDWTHKRRS